jgi:hypothetical protein
VKEPEQRPLCPTSVGCKLCDFRRREWEQYETYLNMQLVNNELEGFNEQAERAPATPVQPAKPAMTLSEDSQERKDVPLYEGCMLYFPAALAGLAQHSKMGNDKHNPGQPLHHSRNKSTDHESCIVRHLMDLGDLEALVTRSGLSAETLTPSEPYDAELIRRILAEANALFWRAGALSQKLHEKYGGAPLAPGAKL